MFCLRASVRSRVWNRPDRLRHCEAMMMETPSLPAVTSSLAPHPHLTHPAVQAEREAHDDGLPCRGGEFQRWRKCPPPPPNLLLKLHLWKRRRRLCLSTQIRAHLKGKLSEFSHTEKIEAVFASREAVEAEQLYCGDRHTE